MSNTAAYCCIKFIGNCEKKRQHKEKMAALRPKTQSYKTFFAVKITLNSKELG
jgi:hypothetical protein